MDLTSTVRSDTLPAVGSLLVPGAVAAVPYVALAWGHPHNLKLFVDDNQGIATAAAALLVVSAGLLVESFGSYVEYFGVDRIHPSRDQIKQEWERYLQIAWEREPLGQHYLRRVLTIFKFELNMCAAALLSLPGTGALSYFGVIPPHAALATIAGSGGAAVLFFLIAANSSMLLAEIRKLLIAQALSVGALKTSPDAA